MGRLFKDLEPVPQSAQARPSYDDNVVCEAEGEPVVRDQRLKVSLHMIQVKKLIKF